VDKDTGEIEDKKYRIKDTDTKDFWLPVLMQKSFIQFIKDKYEVGSTSILNNEDIDKELAELDLDE
jgi:phage host-nuclease inhibitor protein Gam